ncbi:MAG: hypothetical protein AAFY36_06405 [Bacteroidota bacterium]
MLELKDLVSYVTMSRLRRLSFFYNLPKGKGTQLTALYHAISNNEVADDDEACTSLFGKKKDPRYAKVKHRLKKQLIDTVLLLEPKEKGQGDYHEIFTDLRKKLCVADVMRRQGRYNIVYDIVSKVCEKAKEAEMASLCLHSADLMMTYYLFGDYKTEKRKEYIDMARRYNHIYQAEVECHASYHEFLEVVEDTKLSDKDRASFALGLLNRLDDSFPNVSTIEYNSYYNTIKIAAKVYSADYESVKKICSEQIDLLVKKPVYPRGHVRNYLFQLINVSLPTKDFETGKAAYERIISIVDVGVRPWFRAKQLYIYLAIHTSDYKLAFDTCNNVMDHRKFKNQQGEIRERFLLLRAYLSWLREIGEIDTGEKKPRKFRLRRFLNEVPEFSKKKRRFNIPILVVQLLWVIIWEEYDEAEDRLRALSRYTQRNNLRGTPGLERTNYFLKALAKLRSARFNRTRFEEKTSDLLDILAENPSTVNPDAIEIEIVPYETLYKLLLEQL